MEVLEEVEPQEDRFYIVVQMTLNGYHGNFSTLALQGVSVAMCLCGDKAFLPQKRKKSPKAKDWK